MPRRSKKVEQELGKYRNRIEAAKKFRQSEGYDDLWHRLVDLYRGKHWPAHLSDYDKVTVNIAFSTINVISPSVAVNHPKIAVHARQPENFDKAVIAEGVLDYWWRHYDMHDQFRRSVDDFLIIGFGWLKTGYRFVEEEEDRSEDEIAADFEKALDEADQGAVEDPEGAVDLPDDQAIMDGISTTTLVVKEDRPFMERVSPWDIYVDPEATSVHDMRWIAQRNIRTLKEVREDENYDAAARRKVEPDSRIKDDWKPADVGDDDPDFKRVTVWEFYDLATGILAVFSEKGEDFLIAPHDQPYEFGHPYVMLRNYNVPDMFYPIGELEAIEGLQQELNVSRTAMLNDSKSQRRKYLYKPQSFDDAGIAALKSDVDNTMVPTNGNDDLSSVIMPMPSQQLNPQMYQTSDIIEGDIQNITGVNEYMRGGEQEIRRTATEASIIQDAANSRSADKLAKIEKVIGVLGQRLLMLAQQFLTEPQVARIEGVNGADYWFEFEPEDLAGEFDFLVEGGSTQPKNEAARQNQAMSMLQALSPFAVPGGPININALLHKVLQDGFGVKDPSKFLNSANGVTDALGAEAPLPEEPQTMEPIPGEGAPPADIPQPGAEGGIPPALLAQLGGQVNPSLDPAQTGL